MSECPECGQHGAASDEMKASLFPVMNQPPQAIPWWIARMAYQEYSKRHSQSFERLAERGGLGQTELIDLLANYAQSLERKLINLEHGGS